MTYSIRRAAVQADVYSVMERDILQVFEPSRDALLDLLRRMIDEPMLRRIASADYGFDEEHFRGLLAIWKTGRIPMALPRHPHEVIELMVYSEPDNESRSIAPARGHICRAFACAVVLQEPDSFVVSGSEAVVQLVRSGLVLGRDVERSAARSIAWWVHENPRPLPCFELALLWLAFFLNEPPFVEPILARLARGVIEAEARSRSLMRREVDAKKPRPRWMPTMSARDRWKLVARQVLDEAGRLRDSEAREQLIDISERLLFRKGMERQA